MAVVGINDLEVQQSLPVTGLNTIVAPRQDAADAEVEPASRWRPLASWCHEAHALTVLKMRWRHER